MSDSAASFLFIDSRVPDLDAVVAAAREGVTIVVLDPAQDGVHQIAQALEGHTEVASISIVSHGDEGVLLLGSGALHAGNMVEHAADLQEIGSALAATGDILLYGCDVAAGEQGAAFVAALGQATGADVAASNDATGGAGRGDWDLETATGNIEAAPALEASDLAAYDHALVTQSVSTRDELQSAIDAGASDGQADIITLLADVGYTSGSDTISFHILDGKTTTLVGGGHTIDAQNLGRVLAVTNGSVALDNITLTNGFVAGNGGAGTVFTGDSVGGAALGAGIFNAGTLTITNSSITDNKAAGGGAGGVGNANAIVVGGGGGGGGFGGTPGGAGGSSGSGAGGSATPGTGGNGSAFDSLTGGGGGSTVGGLGGSAGGYSPGGAGGTASNGIISIGGGGGAAAESSGATGGTAVAGIYNTGTLTVVNSIISGNIAAGGGGSGGGVDSVGGLPRPGGNGGLAVATIWNNGGTVVLDTATTATMASGNAAAGGFGGQAIANGGTAGTNGVAVSTSAFTSSGGATSIVDPPATTIAAMAFSADTGDSGTDFITKVAAQTLSGTTSANLAAGQVVEVSFDNGVTWALATSAVGSNTWSITETLSGSGTLQVKVSNVVGSGPVASQAYVLDTVAASSTPDLHEASDTGASAVDNVTADETPTFTGTAETGALVQLFDANNNLLGQAVATDGTWSITSSALAEGTHVVSTRVTDVAGNVSASSAGLTVAVDLSAPVTAVTGASFSRDTGRSGTDFVTRNASQVISGTLGTPLDAGESVQVSLDNGLTWDTATVALDGIGWSFGATLSGSGTMLVRVMDVLDRAGVARSQAYVLDTTAPDPLARPTLSPGSDRGVSSADAITKDATPIVRGTAEAGARVRLYDTDGTLLGVRTADADGNWSITSDLLASGTHQLTVTSTDHAGNIGAPSAPLEITIDRERPTVVAVTSSNASGTYTAGDVIAIKVRFSEAVVVGGEPHLVLATGNGGAVATFAGGSGSKVLTFHYTVQPGDRSADLDYVGVGALRLDNGSITDIAGKGVVRDLPEPGTAGSLSHAKDIVIQRSAPSPANAHIDNEVQLIGVAQEAAYGF